MKLELTQDEMRAAMEYWLNQAVVTMEKRTLKVTQVDSSGYGQERSFEIETMTVPVEPTAAPATEQT